MKRFAFYLLLVFIFISCEPNANDPSVQEDGNIKVEKNGVAFELTEYESFQATTFQFEDDLITTALKIRVDSGLLGLYTRNWDWQIDQENKVLEKVYDTNLQGVLEYGPNSQCKTINNYDYCDFGQGEYFDERDNNRLYISESIEDEPNGEIVILYNDPEKKIISGTFDFMLQHFGGEDKIHFKGEFSNISYE